MFQGSPRIMDRAIYITSEEKQRTYVGFILQKLKLRNHHLLVENKNLRNTIKNMESEIQNIKGALSQEELQRNLLTKNLQSKEEEMRQSKSREGNLNSEIKLLQSKLCKETLKNKVLDEWLKQVTSERSSCRGFNKRLCYLIGRIRRFRGGRRGEIEDEKQPHDIAAFR